MKVLFISPNREEINMRTWPLGMACVAASTRAAGHEVELLDLIATTEPQELLRKTIARFRPAVIAMSVRNIDDQSMRGGKFLLDEVKDFIADCRLLTEAPIVLGGAGYSMFPESSLEYLGGDMGIQGEGEAAFPELLDRLQNNSDLAGVPGLYLPGRGSQGMRAFAMDLDNFPLPEPDLLAPGVKEGEEFWLPVQTRRGCPMRCSYCSTETIEGRLIRKRSPAIVVKWLAGWAKAGYRHFHFVDNTFNLPPSYARELCSRIADEGLNASWRAILYPGKISEALVREMARSGCKEVSIGFESGCESVLNAMNKRFSPEEVRVSTRLLGDYGISRMGFLMLGGPGETRESAEESLAFADSLNLEALRITVGIRIYPYTALAKTAVEDGLITADDNLLVPRFYVVRALKDWICETVAKWANDRPNWIVS